MNYKDNFYEKYLSAHAGNIYAEPSLEKMESQFRVLERYFGGLLPEDKKVKMLDLGCGSGEFVYWLQKSGYDNSEGIDISGEQVSLAGRLGIKNVSRADARDFLKANKGKYGFVFARDLLEHFSKDELLDLTKLIFDSLGKDGKFVAQVPNAGNLFWGRLRHGDFTHDVSFTEQGISQLLMVSGFRKISAYPQRPVIHGIKSFVRYVLWRIIELRLKIYLLIERGSSKGIFTPDMLVLAEK